MHTVSPPQRAHPSAALGWGLACLVLSTAACAPDQVGGPGRSAVVRLVVIANVQATSVSTVVIEVTGPDITTPLVFHLSVVSGVASGTITVPTGSSRTFTGHAYDVSGVETHRGAVTQDIRPGTYPPLAITLTPLTGDVPVVVTISGFLVVVTPAMESVAVNGTARFTAAVTLTDGTPVTGPVQWASLNPGLATVDTGGLVTGRAPGSVQIVAIYGGVGAAGTVVVLGAAEVPPALQLVASGLTNALFVTAAPGDTARVFVVQQGGRVRVVRNDTLLTPVFLDLTALVSCCGERGLLGMAFHPQYASNLFFYVNYTDLSGNTQVARYKVSADANVADAASAVSILSQVQPFSNHNGGMLAFGPDGYLYIGLGDGGSGGDPQGNGQNLNTMLGKMLRIDVDGALPYAVPPTNPFVGVSGVPPEIWASGLRNPWRYSFDRTTGDLYIADVGESEREEVDLQPAAGPGGLNYGWNTMEGAICYNAASCTQTGLTLPVLDYTHADGCSIAGGYVYRGTRVPILAGHYLYSDYCSGFVKSFRFVAGQVVDRRDWSSYLPLGFGVSSFGENSRGELYITTLAGNVYRIVPAY